MLLAGARFPDNRDSSAIPTWWLVGPPELFRR